MVSDKTAEAEKQRWKQMKQKLKRQNEEIKRVMLRNHQRGEAGDARQTQINK